MTISVWRYSHLALAISSFLFIALASITGIILAFEPVSQKMQPYRSPKFGQLTLADAIPAIKKNYTDITEVSVDDNEFLVVEGVDKNDEQVKVYVDPANGNSLGRVPGKNAFFQWVTNLHRSLFIHETGRLIIGLASFLLLLIAISGTILIIQRQRGVKRFFNKVVKDGFAQYYHVVLGRLSLIVIIVIALSGTVLSLEKFGFIADLKSSPGVDVDRLKTLPEVTAAEFPIFRSTKLSDVQRVEFPFSDEVEDYYTLQLKEAELTVNQKTGEILTRQFYPSTASLIRWSMNLHTGRTSAVWAIVLAIACVNILFFIWSGFAMTLKRRKGKIKNKYTAADSTIIILVGSENGHTFRFAKAVQHQLILSGQRCFVSELNGYTVFPKAKQLLIMTATYGLGDAPHNAGRFPALVEKFPQPHTIPVSVLGFGSRSYPDFCKYAFEVNNILLAQPWARPLVEIHTVNDRSPHDFSQWAAVWFQKIGLEWDITDTAAKEFTAPPGRLYQFAVAAKQISITEDTSFLLRLEAPRRLSFNSGDLFAIYPANDHRERQYSIGKINGQIQLSVKLHEGGLGSSFLYGLQPGHELSARIVSNAHFYFPAGASQVVMISNGTGIAPFLGMIEQNAGRTDCRLYCGFKSSASFQLYQTALEEAVHKNYLQAWQVGYSREGERQYVSDLLKRDALFIATTLANRGVLLLCGSLSMQTDVIAVLDIICRENNNQSVSYYQSHGQVLMDCY